MRPYIIWIINLLLLAVLIWLFLYNFMNIDPSGEGGMSEFLLAIFVLIAIVFGTGLVLGLLLAILPISSMSFSKKLAWTFPLSASAIALILNLVYGMFYYYENVLGQPIGDLVKYEDVTVPIGTDCVSVHDGDFITGDLKISRKGNKQVQKDGRFGANKAYQVEWLSDCEYSLTRVGRDEPELLVKITAVNDTAYECYVAEDEFAYKQTILFVKN